MLGAVQIPVIREEGTGRSSSRIIIITLIITLFIQLSAAEDEIQVASGSVHVLAGPTPPEGQSYSYLWNVTDGLPRASDSASFRWTAPQVSRPQQVDIGLLVSSGAEGCINESHQKLLVVPRGAGSLSLKKSLDPSINPDNIKIGDTVIFIITIANTGETNITELPLVDSYPNRLLEPKDSSPAWKSDVGSAETRDGQPLSNLTWNNLLSGPLPPGSEVSVRVSFMVLTSSEQIVNLASVEGAIDDTGSTLEPEEAEFTVAPAPYICKPLGPATACAGVGVHFAAPIQNLPSYEWTATDEQMNSVGGFNDSTRANVTWTPPGPGTFRISFNSMTCSQTITVSQCAPSIKLNKSCEYKSPVVMGDMITYTYQVTNDGGVPLTDLNLTDVQNWGPNCQPVYIRGDDGDHILNPGETWYYECEYKVANPTQDPELHTMAAANTTGTESVIRKLMEIETRLEIILGNLRPLQQQFDTKAATETVTQKPINGANYTLINYTNIVTGEALSKIIDPEGSLNKTYFDPLSGSVFTTLYDPSGKMIAEEILIPATKEYLKIQYDLPYSNYKTYTVIDFLNGDTLTILVDPFGNIISKEYAKTPGYRPYVERYFLRNTATVTAKAPDGTEVSDSDSFTLEVFLPLPILKVTKEAEPDPVAKGGLLNYTITFENLGGADAHDVVLTETYDKDLEFITSDPPSDFGTTNTWTIGDLLVGQSGVLRVKGRVSSLAATGQKIKNVVDLTCKENASAEAVINTTVVGSPLNITKSVNPIILQPDESFTYTLNYRNDGQSIQRNVTVQDFLDDRVTLLTPSASPPPNQILNESLGPHLIWWIGDLNPGDRGTIEIFAKTREQGYFNNNTDTILNICRINNSENMSEFDLTTPVVTSLWINKTADKSSVYRGDNITYTITYGNADPRFTFTDIWINDTLPEGVEPGFLQEEYTFSSSRSVQLESTEDNVLRWHLSGDLRPGDTGSIVFSVYVPKLKMNFTETSSVKGDGYTYVRKFLSTAEEKPSLTNRVTIRGHIDNPDYMNETVTASASVTIIGAEGTVVRTTEHGSGHYEEDEKSSMRLENRSIKLEKSIFAKHRNTSFSLPHNRTMKFTSLWSDRTGVDNRILGDVLTENYLYTDTLQKNISLDMDMNQTVYKSESDFRNGTAQISYKQHTKYRPRSQIVTKDIAEDYQGSFKVMESIDSYGESTKYQKSSLGKGFVLSDVRPDRLQRSYEFGNGYYSSEEASESGFVVKNVKMLYEPLNETAGGRNISYAIFWGEGMWTKDRDIGYVISEGFRSATSINKEAQMGRNFLSLLGDFNGTMDLKMVMGPSPKNETHRVEQTFSGSFRTNTAFSVSVIPLHLGPHLWVSKDAVMTDPETVLFTINVTNDGSRLLAPLNVTDFMPAGLIFLNSSMRPEITGQIIRWTVVGLESGRTLNLKLYARMREGIGYPFVNRVIVEGHYQDQVAVASNWTSVNQGYLPVSPMPISELAGMFDIFHNEGHWGDWNPSPCFNMTLWIPTAYYEIERYYDQLDIAALEGNCSPYEVP